VCLSIYLSSVSSSSGVRRSNSPRLTFDVLHVGVSQDLCLALLFAAQLQIIAPGFIAQPAPILWPTPPPIPMPPGPAVTTDTIPTTSTIAKTILNFFMLITFC
jgi:hypothetical protein